MKFKYVNRLYNRNKNIKSLLKKAFTCSSFHSFGVHSILAMKPRPAAWLPCNNNNNHSLSQGQVRYLPTMRSKKPEIKAIKDVFLLSERKMSANANLKRYSTSDESNAKPRTKIQFINSLQKAKISKYKAGKLESSVSVRSVCGREK